MDNNTLYEIFDILEDYGTDFPPIPDYIKDNLAYDLRQYQIEAISRFLHYYDVYKTKNEIQKSPQLLWQMATGSGKTLIMAALILEMYKRGYRNFWFFVTSTDIITKTIDNFINTNAKKYQFAKKIVIDGQIVQIKQVKNFDDTDNENINIKFSTINILHQISQPDLISENQPTLEDFKDFPVVLIGDEAHHLNASTKKAKDDAKTWENSVQLILNSNLNNRLFEFTATANLSDNKIFEKYKDKIIYNYDLKHFREDKFSKDVFTFSTDGDIRKIMLRAVLISQYRKHIAADNNISLKPVILFKSKGVNKNKEGINGSKENFEEFNQIISSLSTEVLENELVSFSDSNDVWNKTVDYFKNPENIDLFSLVDELKMDFDADTKKVLLHDGTNKRVKDQPKLLATLEDEENPVRAIFAVEMLKEGWDVLNLFDIVRLYDTMDGKRNREGEYIPGSGTVSEAQLIGRGARYFPFNYNNKDKFKRKFDNNEDEPLRIIEQMHYHCGHNPRYIYEIRQTLVESGIMAGGDLIQINLEMKKDFIDGKYKNFQEKNVYVNKLLDKVSITNNIDFMRNEIDEQKISLVPDFSEDAIFEVQLSSDSSQTTAVFENNKTESNEISFVSKQGKLSDFVPYHNIIRYAINSNKNFNFDKLKKAYPKLDSITEFIKKLGEKKIIVKYNKKINNFSSENLLYIVEKVLNSIINQIKEEQKRVIVSKHFYPQNAGKSFERKIIRKTKNGSSEIGKSQLDSEMYRLDLSQADWYVYNDNFGTCEEKSFVKWFADNFMVKKTSGKTELEEKGWEDIFLVRNEKAIKLYSWFKKTFGEGFEPDFVLLMKKNEIEYVFYIEPKGNWTYNSTKNDFGDEQWKEDFLLEIEDVVKTQQAKVAEIHKWKLIGLPFYNENNTQKIFSKSFYKEL